MRAIDLAARSLLATLAVVAVLSAAAIGVAARWFGLTVGGATALYFIVWWTLLFAVLPVRIRSQAEVGEVAEGSEPGAPANPALRERAIWTTIVSAVVFVGLAAVLPLSGL